MGHAMDVDAVTDLGTFHARRSRVGRIHTTPIIEGPVVDDTLTLQLDLTDYLQRPSFDGDGQNMPPAGVAGEESALTTARGVLRGLMLSLCCWAVIALIALIAI